MIAVTPRTLTNCEENLKAPVEGTKANEDVSEGVRVVAAHKRNSDIERDGQSRTVENE